MNLLVRNDRGEFSRRRRKECDRSGVAAVEFALVVPLFVLLFFGMIEIGRGVMAQHILEGAARAGAREAMLEGSTETSVQSSVNEYLQDLSVSGVTVSVSPNPANLASRDPVTVTVVVPSANVSWLGFSEFLGPQLTASATVRKEGP
jgi:Flp pilus assembly protein TadG